MTERRREWMKWAILFCFVYLAGNIAQHVAAPVLYWIFMSIIEIFRLPPRISGNLAWGSRYVAIAIKFVTLGFTYCWLMASPWRKSGLLAGTIIVALDNILFIQSYQSYGLGSAMLHAIATAAWFYADTAVACAAALTGAWLAHKNRYHPKLGIAKELLLRTLVLNG